MPKSQIFNWANMFFNAICENKNLTIISEFTVVHQDKGENAFSRELLVNLNALCGQLSIKALLSLFIFCVSCMQK